MSQYPVNTSEGIQEGVNYLLSGPSGLGQNFAGFSSFDPVKYLTGNFRIPFSQIDLADLYVTGISISNAVQLDDRTIKYFFTGAPLASVPFSLGNGLTITGIIPTTFNSKPLRNAGSSIQQIGVVESTNSYVVVRTVSDILQPLGTYVSGGSIEFNTMDAYTSTDCDVRVTVTGGTDRVFVSGQIDQKISYQALTANSGLTVYAAIRRYKAFINKDPVNPDYIFEYDSTIVEKAYPYLSLTGTGSLNLIETVFTSILDKPVPAYYRYILDLYFQTSVLISTTGVVGSVVGTDPWTATITGMTTNVGIVIGSKILADDGTGSLGSESDYIVTGLIGTTGLTYTTTGGTTPVAGTITNILLSSDGDIYVTQDELRVRSLSAQVVKQ